MLVENGSIHKTLKMDKWQCGGMGDRNGELGTHFKVCAKKTKSKRMEYPSLPILSIVFCRLWSDTRQYQASTKRLLNE